MTRVLAIELAAQVALALAIGVFVSLVLAGAALLLADGADTGSAAAEFPIKAVVART